MRKKATASSLRKRMELKNQEKRQYPRLKLKVPLKFQVRGKPEYYNSITTDISLNGVGFVHDDYLPPATNLMLDINVLSRVLNPIGRIAWVSPLAHSNRYHYGIEFMEIDQEKRSFLAQYLDMQKQFEFGN